MGVRLCSRVAFCKPRISSSRAERPWIANHNEESAGLFSPRLLRRTPKDYAGTFTWRCPRPCYSTILKP